MYDQYRDDPV